jgi:hypothetical protein
MGAMARTPEAITQALAELRRPRPCRVCGTVFRPERFDTRVCSDTCRWRRTHGDGGDLAYVEALQTEAARAKARHQHAHIEALIKEVQAHTAAERERRRQRRAAENLGWETAKRATFEAFVKAPNGTRAELIATVLKEFPDVRSVFVNLIDGLLVLRDHGRRVVLEGIAANRTREQLIEAVLRTTVNDPKLAAAIVDAALAELQRRDLWRLAVIKALINLPKADRGGHEAIVAAISKALPDIPVEAISEILLRKDLT